MSNAFEGVAPIMKRQLVIFFVIDKSGSMSGTKIGAVNTAIREVLPELKGIGGADAELKIAALLFSGDAEWMYPEPVPAHAFQWNTVTVDTVTNLGAACDELCAKMTKNAFLKAPSASYAPVVILLSDGQPTDEYKAPLDMLKRNNWFRHAIRFAIAIGDDADEDVLAEFTGNKEAVVRVHTPEALKKIIKFVTVTSSQVGCKGDDLGFGGQATTKSDAVVKGAVDFMKDDPGMDQDAADQWE
jgi:uncharacterized protein YegL